MGLSLTFTFGYTTRESQVDQHNTDHSGAVPDQNDPA